MARSQEASRIPAPGLMAATGFRMPSRLREGGAPKLLSLYHAPGVNRFFGDRTLMVGSRGSSLRTSLCGSCSAGEAR